MKVLWESKSDAFTPHDCFLVGQDHWYGGSETAEDSWTIEKQHIPMQPYLSTHIGVVSRGHGSVLERYWLSSRGVALWVEDDVPLHVGVNRSQLCFKADFTNSQYRNPSNMRPKLNYSICVGDDVLSTHQFVSGRYIRRPSDIINEDLFRAPIWSTWAVYRRSVNQKYVHAFASDIRKYGFTASHIEIDDKYTKHYGDFLFNHNKFPDPSAMSITLGKMGFQVSSWVTPFVNPNSEEFAKCSERNILVKSGAGEAPALVWWPRGPGALVDFTHPKAAPWLQQGLNMLKSQGVHSFKVDDGESYFLPKGFSTHGPLVNPNHYARLWAETVFNVTGDRSIEVRVGYKSQHLPIMVRMMDKDSVWDNRRGLKSLIPTTLLFGLLGYPFVLPDMIGGNGHAGQVKVEPDKELFLRWLAASVLLPVLQFSIPPWKYDNKTVEITRKLLRLRNKYVSYIIQVAHEAVRTGHPIIRPLWWLAPKDPIALRTNDQFLVGTDLMVAPVVSKGQRERNIYLPPGRWYDPLRKKTFIGRRILMGYDAGLSELPIFERIDLHPN